MKDGSPQVTPVWVDSDGSYIRINTADGRVKARNMRRDGRVALSIMGMESSQRSLFVRGRVKEITAEGANQHIDSLSLKYSGNPVYPGHARREKRLKILIEPLHITQRGL
jgi:PPOX class probable F420-dependent enzyme